MVRKKSIVAVVGLVVLGLSAVVGHVQAQGLPPGIHVEVLAEYPSTDPNIAKIVVKKFTVDPGAKLENFTPKYVNL